MKIFKTKYRIARDAYAGYEAQYKPWWSPFWMQCYGLNTMPTVDLARKLCFQHATEVVEYVNVDMEEV